MLFPLAHLTTKNASCELNCDLKVLMLPFCSINKITYDLWVPFIIRAFCPYNKVISRAFFYCLVVVFDKTQFTIMREPAGTRFPQANTRFPMFDTRNRPGTDFWYPEPDRNRLFGTRCITTTDCSSKAEALQHKEKRAIENVVAICSVCNAFEFPLLTLPRQHQSMLQKQANVGYRLQFQSWSFTT